ncbi:MAG: uncharacterized protein KVP18_003163 [Porospora cf. gigantea A]|uniref:uncharacterized protein n=1 Tax=Porospora cf. gigantea A TaxID=2853593 RepID=UPI003559994F|nr:MAG: hypothetical protein KVP18_003163 [Porospora cf. gigantea A]
MALLGVGNPLLDTIVCADEAFMDKYNLVKGGYCFQGEGQEAIYDDMASRTPVYVPGGATQNSIRVAQGLLPSPSTAYSGSSGKDKEGERMRDLLETCDVKSYYYWDAEHPTGMCGVAVSSCGERSLCTRLGAADHFPFEHLQSVEMQRALADSKFVYSAGFFLTVCTKGMVMMGKHCSENNKVFASNLCAEFIVEHFKDQMLEVLPFMDYIFGNESEWAHFARIHAEALGNVDPANLQEVARRVAQLPKVNTARSRVVVVTQGSDETIVASKWFTSEAIVVCDNKRRLKSTTLYQVSTFPVVPLDPSMIVDTNGAGDAFVGGFLAGLVQDKALPDCVALAHYAARHIVQRSGATVEFEARDREHPFYSSEY